MNERTVGRLSMLQSRQVRAVKPRSDNDDTPVYVRRIGPPPHAIRHSRDASLKWDDATKK
jgi:hypothetical protein